jgi:hypothetical protein
MRDQSLSKEGKLHCVECGADLPGAETCQDRFHALLASDFGGVAEAFQVHGLTVLTFHIQHAGSARPPVWWQAEIQEVLWQIFGRGRDWQEVLAEYNRQDVADRWKARFAAVPGPLLPFSPVQGEMTIAGIDPAAPPGHAARVLAWACSVAEARGLTTAPPVFEV